MAVPFGISSSRRVVLEPFDAEAARCEPPPLLPLNFCQKCIKLQALARPVGALKAATGSLGKHHLWRIRNDPPKQAISGLAGNLI